MQFSVHAIDQYIARCRPGMSYPVAVQELREHAAAASHVRKRTPAGDEMLYVESLDCYLVVKRERGGPVCVTILGGDEKAASAPAPTPEQRARTEASLRTEAIHALHRYLAQREARGDRHARRLLSQLRLVGILW